MGRDFYADIASIYDRMIRWDKRLKFEEPLFAALWRRTGARSVLDASCGSGRHLLLFARQGLRASGADASPAMLELAREQLAALPEPQRPPLIQSTWAELPATLGEVFDVVLCLGNSLPYVTDSGALSASLAGLVSRVAPGGVLLIQFKNFARMRARGERYLPVSNYLDPATGEEFVGVRQYEWHEATVDFNVIVLRRERADPAAQWTLSHWSTPLATYRARDVAGPLEALGAQVRLYGSLALEPYDEWASEDVVLWASAVG